MDYSRLKKENMFMKFSYRVVKKTIVTRSKKQLKEYYSVQRRTKLFGIPLWWTSSFLLYPFDGVNYNEATHTSKDDAIKQMKDLKSRTDYNNKEITKIEVV